jgi:hypothetical protein
MNPTGCLHITLGKNPPIPLPTTLEEEERFVTRSRDVKSSTSVIYPKNTYLKPVME